MARKKAGSRHLKVSSPRNSSCSSRLSCLDWSDWFTDDSFGAHYLHVRRPDNDTYQTVRCRHARRPRLEMRGGELHWLVDPPKPETEVPDHAAD
jgi:hypothetical protein